jgi:hypothetical protein
MGRIATCPQKVWGSGVRKHHPSLALDRQTLFHRRHVRKSQSPATEQQIVDEYDQQNTADTDTTAITPPVIAEPAPEEED